MPLFKIKNTVLLFVTIAFCFGCKLEQKPDLVDSKNPMSSKKRKSEEPQQLVLGVDQIERYAKLISNKRVGVVANQTSVIYHDKGNTHLVDTLLALNYSIEKVFAPEHGFRGTADAGEIVKDGLDVKTGLPIISLYGKNKKPSSKLLADLDVMIFDIQDVGARFYTYISTLHYVMEACAESKIPVIILDRPNPNGHYIDGPILDMEHQSFVGMHPVPVVHGMTIGEYAIMINGEAWLDQSLECELHVIEMKNYNHQMSYELPIKPSPNLPNSTAINLYPSLCFFEGTNVSAGRGTNLQFQIFGSPYLQGYDYNFIPKPNAGAKYPKHKGEICYGVNLSESEYLDEIRLDLSLIHI